MQWSTPMDATLVQSGTQAASVSKKMLWAGRIVSALPVLFLVFGGAFKVANPAPVVESMALLGYPEGLAPAIGVLLLACVALYAFPRTSVLGAVLLTGYFGGAIATQVRVSAEPFSIIFPIVLGLLVLGGLYLRDDRLRALVPWRS